MTKTANTELSKQVLNNVKQLNDFHIRATVGKTIIDNTAKAMKNLNKETEKLHNGTIDLFDLIHLVPPELRGIIYPLSSLEKILPVVTTLQLAYNAALKGASFSEITQNLLKLSNTTWISKLFDKMFNITVAGAGLITIFKSEHSSMDIMEAPPMANPTGTPITSSITRAINNTATAIIQHLLPSPRSAKNLPFSGKRYF